MLAYKAWCESRARFAVAAAAVALATAGFVLLEATFRSRMVAVGGPALGYAVYVDLRVFTGVVRALFLLLAVVLGLGGLSRERAHGTLAFTLALPVPRSRHLLARAAVGLGQLVALAALPVLLVPACSLVVGQGYPLAAALARAAGWLPVGAAAFAVAVAISVAVRNEYAALAIAVVALRFVPRLVPLSAGSAAAIAIAVAVTAAALLLAAALTARERLAT